MQEPQIWERIVPISDMDIELFNGFTCGVAEYDQWLRVSACFAQRRGECSVHVCLDAIGSPIAFFTLSSASINSCEVRSRFRGGLHGSIPATLLGKLGVRTDRQGIGVGSALLIQAMRYTLLSTQYVSSRLLVVDALTADLIPWYEKRGFRRLPGNELRLVCKMSEVRRICE